MQSDSGHGGVNGVGALYELPARHTLRTDAEAVAGMCGPGPAGAGSELQFPSRHRYACTRPKPGI
ncbi:hypothetical protein Sar04_35870 [Salinispora arenicola]|uniref:Uncharacterized protein n=1 Tax=Salinispora arenicola TaxID=168697 RepID=A0ABQ4JXY0_SALAC|nr:hypothetical protein Sar04_35870 [Salinispora arenicola]